MKTFLAKASLAMAGGMALTVLLSAPVMAQDVDNQERRAQMHERRGEFLENNPEAAARMEQRRQRMEDFRANNPEEAARMDERRDSMRNGEGPHPGFEGRRGPGGPGFRGPRPDGGRNRGNDGNNSGV